MEKVNYLNEDLCRKCGGKCCKSLPGGCIPEDFEEPLQESLTEALKGDYAVDWWEGPGGDMEGYYIRPKIKGTGRIYDPAWGGECIFLGEEGCSLDPYERPANCRLLEPVEEIEGNITCVLHGNMDKYQLALYWLPYHRIIKEAAAEAIKNKE